MAKEGLNSMKDNHPYNMTFDAVVFVDVDVNVHVEAVPIVQQVDNTGHSIFLK